MAQTKSYTGWWVAASIAVLCGVSFLYLYFGGWVYGVEFSPDDFSRRRFSYNVMPFTKITVKGIYYDDATPVFEQTLFNDGLIGTAASIKRWHLVSDTVSDQFSKDFDARLLTRFLELKDDNNESIWIAWNEKHPQLSKKFWPIIADLAREYLYLDVADIMEKAIGLKKDDVAAFNVALETISSNAFYEKASILLKNGEPNLAIDCFSKSIEILPTKIALKGRSQAYLSVGEDEKSAADSEAANQLDDQ